MHALFRRFSRCHGCDWPDGAASRRCRLATGHLGVHSLVDRPTFDKLQLDPSITPPKFRPNRCVEGSLAPPAEAHKQAVGFSTNAKHRLEVHLPHGGQKLLAHPQQKRPSGHHLLPQKVQFAVVSPGYHNNRGRQGERPRHGVEASRRIPLCVVFQLLEEKTTSQKPRVRQLRMLRKQKEGPW